MSKQNYYLGQGPWYIIKQYLGLHPGYCYKEFMNLELEVLQKIWYAKAGKAMSLNRVWLGAQPIPYQFQHLLWDNNSSLDFHIENLKRYTCAHGTPYPEDETGASQKRHYNKELTRQYYKKHYPEFLAAMDAMDAVLENDKKLKSVPFDSIKSLNERKLIGSEIAELARGATLDATEAAVKAHSKLSVLKKTILAACVHSPLRLDVYKALDQAVRRRYRVCACGCTVPTCGKAFEKHLKSDAHCKKVLVNCSATSIEAWYQCSGTLPPGFTRSAPFSFSHIIPEDSKRPPLHTIRNSGSADFGPCLSLSSWGRGRYLVLP